MATILTPTILWNGFDVSPELNAKVIDVKTVDGVKYESVNFLGRQTAAGRVKIYGVFACNEITPATETVLIFPDSSDGID